MENSTLYITLSPCKDCAKLILQAGVKRVVFNINVNKYRLLVDREFQLKIVFVVWFGSHFVYDLIDAKTITYVKGNKK